MAPRAAELAVCGVSIAIARQLNAQAPVKVSDCSPFYSRNPRYLRLRGTQMDGGLNVQMDLDLSQWIRPLFS